MPNVGPIRETHVPVVYDTDSGGFGGSELHRAVYFEELASAMLSVPEQHWTLEVIEGTVPDLRAPARACPFAPRCRHRMERCTQQMPILEEVRPGHRVACFLHGDAHE